MAIINRPFHWEDDFELVRDFLIETYRISGKLYNWPPSRFENRKVGPCGSLYKDEEDEFVRIWEDQVESVEATNAKIIAITILEEPNYYWIHTHPNYKKKEDEIIVWLEKYHKENQMERANSSLINCYVYENDESRNKILMNKGYQEIELVEYNRNRSLNLPVIEPEVPNGFFIRNINPIEDYYKIKELISAVFPHCKRMTKKTFRIFCEATFYNPKLDLAVVAPDGKLAAFATIRLDPISKIADFEPIGTHPNFRRLGLSKALMYEGLKRLKEYQPTYICINGAAPTEAANKLYESLGFTEKIGLYLWSKKIE